MESHLQLLYWLDGLHADEGPEYFQFCFDLPDDPVNVEQSLDRCQSADAHIMGRAAYEFMAGSLATATDHQVADILNSALRQCHRLTESGPRDLGETTFSETLQRWLSH